MHRAYVAEPPLKGGLSEGLGKAGLWYESALSVYGEGFKWILSSRYSSKELTQHHILEWVEFLKPMMDVNSVSYNMLQNVTKINSIRFINYFMF